MTVWRIASPISTHDRVATCYEVGCVMHRDGFVTRVDETTALGQQQAHYLRTNRREATETAENGLTVFSFPPGSTCFNTHRKRLDREPFYRIEGGTGRIQVTADEWQHRQATTLEAYKTAQERG